MSLRLLCDEFQNSFAVFVLVVLRLKLSFQKTHQVFREIDLFLSWRTSNRLWQLITRYNLSLVSQSRQHQVTILPGQCSRVNLVAHDPVSDTFTLLVVERLGQREVVAK